MDDATINALGVSVPKMGTTFIDRSTHRWFAERYNVNYAWFFYGTNRSLSNNTVYNAFQVGAVTLLKK